MNRETRILRQQPAELLIFITTCVGPVWEPTGAFRFRPEDSPLFFGPYQ